MITENLSTLKIHKLTKAQYERELDAGRIDENAIYLTPDETADLSGYATIDQVNSKADINHTHDDVYYTEAEVDELISTKADSGHNHDDSYDTKGSADTALASANSYTDTKTSSLASTSSVNTSISTHNSSDTAHTDIRELITGLTTKLNNFLNVDDTTTDQLSEVLTLINNNKGTLESLTTTKINVSDIVDNLTTSNASKVLSANQGVVIKSLIDDLQSELDSHGHDIADVSGLQSALDDKANTSHKHDVADISGAPSFDDVPNLYIWGKYTGEPNTYTETEQSDILIHQSYFTVSSPYYSRNTNCSSEFIISDDVISLVNPTSVYINTENLRGKYIDSFTTDNAILYIPEDAIITTVELSDGITKTTSSVAICIRPNVFSGYVSSKTSDMYPTNGEHTDGYWYVYHRILGDIDELATNEYVNNRFEELMNEINLLKAKIESLEAAE